MHPEEWKKRCAAQFIKRAGVPVIHANLMAEECFKLSEEDGSFAECDPEDAADEDMSYWDYD